MEQWGEKERKNPLRRRLSKVLTSALCGACVEEMFSATLSNAALQIHRELAVVASMYDRPGGPHGESSATCVQWCGWGLVLQSDCI